MFNRISVIELVLLSLIALLAVGMVALCVQFVRRRDRTTLASLRAAFALLLLLAAGTILLGIRDRSGLGADSPP